MYKCIMLVYKVSVYISIIYVCKQNQFQAFYLYMSKMFCECLDSSFDISTEKGTSAG